MSIYSQPDDFLSIVVEQPCLVIVDYHVPSDLSAMLLHREEIPWESRNVEGIKIDGFLSLAVNSRLDIDTSISVYFHGSVVGEYDMVFPWRVVDKDEAVTYGVVLDPE